MLNRRVLMQAGAAFTALAATSGQAMAARRSDAKPTATLEVDVEGQAGAVSPLIFGQFIEFLGRSIDGGIFEKGSPLSDARGFRRDVLDKVRGLRPSILRYPGGTVTKIYHWEDGIGPAAQRPVRPNLIWTGVIDNQFGTDEFIEYSRAVSAEPFITVSMGVGTAEDASNWVEYCNGTQKTFYADKRRKNGYSEPHNVKYWASATRKRPNPTPAGFRMSTNIPGKPGYIPS